MMRRREFITLLGSAAAAWPVAARAQQEGRTRRIGVLIRGIETDGVVQAQLGALREVLAQRGWTDGRNVLFEIRWYDDNPVLLEMHADELVRLAPDAIFVGSRPSQS
jgi:putative ABC transport system substrate-binding protein